MRVGLPVDIPPFKQGEKKDVALIVQVCAYPLILEVNPGREFPGLFLLQELFFPKGGFCIKVKDKNVVKETQIQSRMYPPGEEIT